jgi:aminoglycoside 3-N-acetyltransferase
MHTKSSLHADLARMGAPRNSVVLVHTSLKAVGDVEGRGEGFLEALIEYFTSDGGLLLVPTHTWRNLSDKSKPTLDMTSAETCIGILPSLAALHPYAHRSLHPTHSMSVFDGVTRSGEPGRAEDYIACERLRDPATLTSTSPDGCYGKLYDIGGKVLLIGVGHNRNTYLHSVEERLGIPNRLTETLTQATIKLPSGEIINRPLRSHHAVGITDVSAKYPKYEPAFRKYGAIVDGKLGDAPTQLCDARIMAEVVKLVRERSGGIELLADDTPLDERYY